MDFKTCDFEWNHEKNQLLLDTRNISFERIVLEIKRGNLIEVIPHHNQLKYPGQKIFAVLVDDYVCSVPFVKEGKKCFLKTIFKNRNLTAFYLGKLSKGV